MAIPVYPWLRFFRYRGVRGGVRGIVRLFFVALVALVVLAPARPREHLFGPCGGVIDGWVKCSSCHKYILYLYCICIFVLYCILDARAQRRVVRDVVQGRKNISLAISEPGAGTLLCRARVPCLSPACLLRP